MALRIAGTPAATLDDKTSPQAKALDWISNDDQMSPPLCPSDETEALQRYILASFYFATGGGNWKECNAPEDLSPAAIAAANKKCTIEATKYPIKPDRKYGTDAWLTPKPICDWAGLVCYNDDTDRRGTLDQIDFEDNNLSGSLIDEIGSLQNLRFLILEQGNIEGEIPESIGNLQLVIVDLDFNKLSGKIPQSLYNVKSLQQLDLNDNELTGEMSSDVENWKRMTFLQLNKNKFTGTIPTELGQLKILSEYKNW
jgi:Leucine-rich repeat (LRR) protein